MTPRRPFVRSLRSSARLAVAAAAFAVAACGLDPAATDAPAASAEGRRAAAATPEPAAAPAPPRVVVPKRIRTLSAHVARTVLIGAAAQDARDVIPAPEPAADDDRDDAEPRAAATAGAADDAAAQTAARLEAASLVVGRDDALRGLQPDALRVAVARGAVVFVDAWTGDEAWLLSLAPGGRVRPVTAADEVLAKPHVLTALPPSHSDPDPRILGVEERGELRVIATRQDTLCHDCACGKAAGRRAFARNLSAHAARVFDASRARGAGPEVAIRAASLRGSALHVEATIRNDGPDAVMGRVEVLPREGVHPAYPAAPIAATSATVEPGTTRTVVLDATVARPFDVIEHRVVASRADDVEVVRVVAPLVGLVGAEELRLVTVGSVAAGSRATARVLVRNSLTREGVPDADVTLRLAADDGGDVGAPARSRTDRFGACDVVIDAPETLPAKLRFSATSEVRGVRDEVQAEASAVEDFGAHLFLDLPVHRPGDRVRGRALVVRRPTGRPAAGEQVEFQLLDPEGREVVSAGRTANAFGIADAGLDVPGSAVPGDYTIRLRRASLVVADAQVRIERFEVPRYRLAVAPSARVVRPGATLTVAVEASRFDGAAVGGAEVSASLRTGAWGDSPLARWEGTTDAAGRCDVRLDVPRTAAFAGAPDVVVDVAVRDAGGRAARELVRLASSPENSPAAGDGDADRAAVGATLHLPDGPPAPGAAGRILVRTDLLEGAEIPVAIDGGAPRTATVDTLGFLDVAIDGAASGTVIQVGGTRLTSPAERADLTLTLADRLVAPGTKLRVRIGAPTASQVVFLELLQSGIHAATYTVPVVGGRAEADLDLPAGIDGLVSLQASLDPCDTGAAVVARTAFIVPHERVRVALATGSASYAPGEALRLDVNVTDTTGRGIPAVLGLRIADEAVLSLVRRPPGSARAALALGSSGRGRADEASGLSAASLVQKATRSALTPAERRLLDVLLAETDRVRMPSSDVSSLPPRIAANVRLASAQFERFVEGLPERALAVLDDGSVPPPRQDVPDVVAALQQAALVGAFGPDGFVDPWGTPLVVRTRGSFPLDYVSDNALPEPPLSVEMRSPGPDAAWGTPDDVAGSIDWSALLPLHRRWVTAHGHVFDDAAFELNGRAIGIGGAAGGAFGGRRGGHRNLRAGGGGKKSAVWLAPAPTRERQFFPEALHFGPFVETDADGRAHLDLTAPDSLTTWRAEAVASDAAGRAADGETSFRTTLAFAGEIDAPGTMLVGDEIEVPVVVRWGEGERAALSVEATVSPEAVLLSPPSVQIAPAASGEFALPVRVRAVRAGALRLAVRLNSHTRTDASARTIDVLPAGRPAQVSVSRSVGAATTLRIDRARSVVAGSERVELKLRPSAAADVLDGVDGILRKPHGCFEQASSAVFPNALALRWLQATGGSSPVLRQRFLDAIDEGTDLLLSYEIEGGGFDWFGRAPAKLLLSAYGLHEWRAIHEVRWAAGRESSRTGGAAEIADRTATWLVSQQAADGSFADKDAPYEWRGRVAGRVAATAYVGWALVGDRPGQGAGGDASAVAASSAREFVAAHAAEIDDPYTLAVATVFLLARDPADPVGATLAARLANVRADAAPADRAPVTAFHSRRGTADVEVDALAAIAALRLGNSAALPLLPRLAAIADRRGPDGTWGTTHATVLALWASLAAQTAALPAGSEIVVRPSGGAERRVLVAAEDLGRTVTLDLPGAAAGGAPIEVHIAYAGSGEFGATLVLSHAVPFDAAVAASAGPLSLTVTPSATTLSAGAPLDLDLRVTNSGAAPVAMPTIEVPLASGVLADLPALAALRRRPDVGRVEADASRIVVYLRELAAGATFQCTLRTSPRLRGRVTLPPASAYAYYEPDRIALAKPAVLTVE